MVGVYASVMLFEGFSLHLTATPDNVEGHPFHAANNVNGVAIGSIVDYQVLPLDPRIEALQHAYVQKVVDTVHNLPNVLYEVANGHFIVRVRLTWRSVRQCWAYDVRACPRPSDRAR